MGNALNQSKIDFFDTISVNVPELKMFIKAALETNIPLNVLGATGIGKTDIINTVAKEESCYLIDLNTTTSDVLDTGGLPYRSENDRLKFALSEKLPIRGKDEHLYENYKYVILFIDELPLAPRELQSVLYKLVQERMVRFDFLMEKVRIISAGNLKTDLGNHNEPPAPLKNREMHVYLKPDAKAFCEWGMHNNVHPTIISMIQADPSMLHVLSNTERAKNYKQYTEMYAFNTNRTWANLSDGLWYAEANHLPDTYISTLINANIGVIGRLFYEFYIHSLNIPKVEDVLSGEALKHSAIEKWREKIMDSEYSQALKFYLSYILCAKLSKVAKDYEKNGTMYFMDKSYNKQADNALVFLKEVTMDDVALLQSFYNNYTIRFQLTHSVDKNSKLYQYVASAQMAQYNEYELKTDK